MKYKVFNIEFEGIDKCGKDYIVNYFLKFCPNIYTPKARGIISQMVYTKLYGRNDDYLVSDGYVSNTLFVHLLVEENDWKLRCKLTHEPAVDYHKNLNAFQDEFTNIRNMVPDKRQVLEINTSKFTPYQVCKIVKDRLDELNFSYNN